MAVLSFLDMVTEPGIQVALVRRPGDIERHLETAFSLQLMRGAALSAALYLLAPAIAGFFNIASAVIVVRALAVVVMLRALANPAIARLQRERSSCRLRS
jgi:O-antigen/teichoic acid export membrane protein